MAIRPKAKVISHPVMARRARAKEKADNVRQLHREPGGVDFLHKWFEEKGVRKVKVGASANSSAKGAKARASVGSPRRFVPPILADVVVVASEQLENSNNDPESR